jgi:hypothetical protein
MTPEHKVKADIVRFLTRRGFWVLNLATGVTKTAAGQFVSFGEKGLPDLIAISTDGRLFFCEVKSLCGRLSPEQSAWIRRMRERGVLIVVARSVEDVADALKAAGYLQELF